MGNSFGCSASGERLVSAARDGDLVEAKMLLDCNPCLAKYSTFGGLNSPLHFASAKGHNEIVALLLEIGADVNCRNYCGQTALMQACRYGHWEVVQTLLLYKCNVTRADYLSGRTALHFAAVNGHVRCIRLVVADFVPSSPFEFINAQTNGDKGDGSNIRHKHDQSALTKFVNKAADGGITALHMAALNGYFDCVQLLLNLHANVSAVTFHYGTSMDLIGAGSTPLHYAACGGNLKCCQILLASGASRLTLNCNGWLPLDVARMWGRHWLEPLLAPNSELIIPVFPPSNYLSLPLKSVINIAREFGLQSSATSDDTDLCAVCLERACTVAAEGCGHELCVRCALYLCCDNRTMEDDQKVLDLVKELVNRLLNSPSDPHHPNPNNYQQALKYAVRILSSRMTPSIAADEAAMAEAIKRRLATQGKSSDALTFADLYSKFAIKTGPGSVNNKWAVLYLLKAISEDRKNCSNRSDSRLSNGFLLPSLFDADNSRGFKEKSKFREKLEKHDNSRFLRNGEGIEKGWNGGILLVSKDPENIREMAYREFGNLLKEENEVSEEVLVRDVLYACQGIDGKYVKFEKSVDGYVLPDSVIVPRATRTMVRKLCELGWLFRKVKGYISESMDSFPAEDVGTVGQAFCAALQDELTEYYKLLAVLEVQSMNPIPLVSDSTSSGNYISLRRLSVWFAEPMVKMRLMAVLVDSCKVLKGGAMAGAIHMHAQHGDPLLHDFMKRLLRQVCSPLFEMVRSWVLEGELEDIYTEFFVLGQPVKAESLWREGYRLHAAMLPSFISQSLAHCILRTGKSINFLRVCCEDRSWADAATEAATATGTTTRRGGLGYGETDALESLVTEAAKRIDKHLMDVVYKRYKFKEHCLAIKRYLLLGQGDFVQYLMDIVGPELSEPANTISSFKLAGLLESAVRSSNAQYDDPDILDRLRVKMMPHNTGDRGWDVFSLEYDARVPLNTVFTESVMAKYLRIFNFLWKLRRVEHALIGAWKTMKPNSIASHFFSKLPQAVKLQLILASRRCQVLWDEMNHFITNLQYYIMFEVLEVSWSNFLNEMEVAKDLDDLLAAHEKYLHSIVEKSLLGERSQALYKTLFELFDLILRFRSHADRLYEGVNELQARSVDSSLPSRDMAKRRSNNKTSEPGSWLGEGRKAITQRAGEFLRNTGQDIDAIAKEYSSLFEGFILQLPVQQHVDLKFLMFRLDFTEFYSRAS